MRSRLRVCAFFPSTKARWETVVLRYARGVATFVCVGLVFSCSGGGGDKVTGPPVPAAVRTVEVELSVPSIVVGQTSQGTVRLKDANGNLLTGRQIVWSSSDTTVATITSDGLARGRATGTVTIIATSENVSGNATLAVSLAPPIIASVDTIRPGTQVRIHGAGLGSAATVLLDGQRVAIVTATDTLLVTEPLAIVPCDVDHRPVNVVVSVGDKTARAVATLALPGVLTYAVGESHVLSGDMLNCVQLPGATQDFVLTFLNSRLVVSAAGADSLAVLDLKTIGGPASAVLAEIATSRVLHADEGSQRRGFDIADNSQLRSQFASYPQDVWSANPTQFDPTYATAQVGDTVRMVDWPLNGCKGPLSPSTPYYLAEVAAAAGGVLFAVDLRDPDHAAALEPARKAVLQSAAALVDSVLIPATQAVFDPDYEPLAGGAGRYYMLLADIGAPLGISSDNRGGGGATWSPQRACPAASEMIVTTLNIKYFISGLSAGTVATTAIHEYGHVADAITGNRYPGFSQSSVFAEGWAELNTEAAIRIHTGQHLYANPETETRLGSPSALTGLWGAQPDLSLFYGYGVYSINSSLLVFARELAGESGMETPAHLFKALLYEGFLTTPAEVIPHLASALGLDATTLLDRWSLALATDDLIDRSAAEKADLPQLTTWDTRHWALTHRPLSNVYSRGANRHIVLRAGPGNFTAAYLPADNNLGASLSLSALVSTSAVIRITRLR